MTPIVFLDANVLVPYNLMSILLTMAEDGLFIPRWSQAVLDETSRALVEKLGLPRDDVTRRIQAMTEAFPEAMVTGYEHLEATVNCDPKDRHVLAAAVAAGADALVTVNLRDFPTDEMDRLEIDVLHPEQFLFQVWSVDIDAVRAALLRDATRRVRPPTNLGDLLAKLAPLAPTFANAVHQWGEAPRADISAVPLLVAVEDESTPAAGLAIPDLRDPLHVAMMWFGALDGSGAPNAALVELTLNPGAFGDFGWANDLLEGFGIASRVFPAVDSDDICFVHFVPEAAHAAQAFGSFILSDVVFMTLVKIEDGTWRVWGLGKAMPSAGQVFRRA